MIPFLLALHRDLSQGSVPPSFAQGFIPTEWSQNCAALIEQHSGTHLEIRKVTNTVQKKIGKFKIFHSNNPFFPLFLFIPVHF